MADREENLNQPSIRASIVGSLGLLAWDVGTGSFLASLFACPVWFLVSVIKSATQKPGWTIALVRAAIPLVTLAVVLGNSVVQSRIANANAEMIIAACENFRARNGRFPNTLDELVPEHMPFIPRAKYSLAWNEYQYINSDGNPLLLWVDTPPFGRPTYSFEDGRWGYLD